jgi:two-component system, chemotaxis family, protein-glutamate methylesterase/glutaminase
MSALAVEHAYPELARYVVAIAASAGGLQAVGAVLALLPADFQAAIVVVVHISPNHPSHLAQLLGGRTPLPVKQAAEGNRLCPSTVFVAPPDRHVVVQPGGVLSLSEAAKVHHARPSAEPLFASLAEVYGDNAIAVVLTGGLNDGSTGVGIVKRMGGQTIAQNEATSQDFSMPRSAIATGNVDSVLPLNEIADCLVRLVAGEAVLPSPPRGGLGGGQIS